MRSSGSAVVPVHPAFDRGHVVFPVAAVPSQGADGHQMPGGGETAELAERDAEDAGGFGGSQQRNVIEHGGALQPVGRHAAETGMGRADFSGTGEDPSGGIPRTQSLHQDQVVEDLELGSGLRR